VAHLHASENRTVLHAITYSSTSNVRTKYSFQCIKCRSSAKFRRKIYTTVCYLPIFAKLLWLRTYSRSTKWAEQNTSRTRYLNTNSKWMKHGNCFPALLKKMNENKDILSTCWMAFWSGQWLLSYLVSLIFQFLFIYELWRQVWVALWYIEPCWACIPFYSFNCLFIGCGLLILGSPKCCTIVAIGKPERQVRKASHSGSRQQ